MNWDEVDVALEEIGATSGRATRISAYRLLLDELEPREDGFAEVLMSLGADLTEDGQLDAAGAAYQQALDDGGRTTLDPHTGLLDVALHIPDDARADELLTVLLSRSRADRLVIGDYAWIAEALETAGRLRAALRWYTIPLRDIQPGDLAMMPLVALEGRWRVRRALELPVDAYDEAHDVLRELDEPS